MLSLVLSLLSVDLSVFAVCNSLFPMASEGRVMVEARRPSVLDNAPR